MSQILNTHDHGNALNTEFIKKEEVNNLLKLPGEEAHKPFCAIEKRIHSLTCIITRLLTFF